MPEIPKCLICSQPASKRCSGCHEANYCSINHQRQHWKEHKRQCMAYELAVSEEEGQHLIASRDLEGNVVVVREAPLMYAPLDLEETASGIVMPHCLGCCCRLPPSSGDPNHTSNPDSITNDIHIHRCAKCLWPLCGETCEKVRTHRDLECEIFAKNRVPFPPKKPQVVYASVLILRLLLQKDSNPSLWKKLQDFQCRNKIRGSDYKQKRDAETILENLQEFHGKNEEDLHQQISPQDLQDLIQKVNLHSTAMSKVIMAPDGPPPIGSSPAQEGKNGELSSVINVRGLYWKSGQISHGCTPNTVQELVLPNLELLLRSSGPIRKGEDILTTPDDDWVFLGTYHRQMSKYDGKCQFLCQCSRCSDPTELQTFTSAVKCTRKMGLDGDNLEISNPNCEGFLLPLNPLDLNAEAPWQCSVCAQTEDQEKVVMSLLHHCELDKEKLVARIQDLTSTEKLTALDDLYNLFCRRDLHENHFINRNIQLDYINIAQAHLQQLDFPQLDRLVYHLEKVAQVALVLTSRLSRQTAILRLQQCRVLLRRKAKAAKEAKTAEVFGDSKTGLLEYLQRLDQIQRETIQFYERDASNGKIVKLLKEENAIVGRDMKVTMSHLLK